ncbi:MAG: SDR family oxidoreductase [Desulfobacteraceae bacterium]|nr:SDR family oxidoreductase [Desulfobacteraceae bacterium]MBC2757568.1 SDR family oxidoreductase [Desulfobacteraceae bacterium]
MIQFNSDFWAIIIGGSSGFGLATAEKLAKHGMNLCIVHRDRRGAMSRITPEFEKLKSTGVNVLTLNLDALSADGRTKVLDMLKDELGDTGKVRMVLHAVAFGNLKLLAPYHASGTPKSTREKIAKETEISAEVIEQIVQKGFEDGSESLYTLVDPPEYNNRQFLEEDDFSRTIHAMGSNIVEWVQDIFHRKFFADDARVLSLTSEGNSVAWRGYAAVAAAKAVLESVSRAMAVEFAPYGIRSNVIQAGVTDTAALQAIPGNRHIKANAALRNPFGRLTTPVDVANVIFLLCMDEAAWINGALICADGGERIA